MLRERAVERGILRAHVRSNVVLFCAVEEDEEVPFLDNEEIENPTRALFRRGVGLEQAGAFGQTVASDARGQADARALQEGFLVGGRNLPAEFTLADALGNQERHSLLPMRFLLSPQSSDLIHAGLGGGIDGKFHDAETGGFEIKGDAPGLDNLGEEQPDGRRDVETDFVKHLVSFGSEVFFNPNL